jgi:8-oxo-dGTP pyrophosphatase MutT (NUDIX family)
MTTAPSPADSATVIVLREAGDGCEVLLVERHAKSRAFAGAHVFPGGVVDAEDVAPGLHAASPLTAKAAAARLQEKGGSAAALAYWIAAIRELFEETGLLLARRDGSPLRLDDAATQARFRKHRSDLLAGSTTFAEIVAAERLELTTDGLHYFSRWITPVNVPRRYDARFFVAAVPPGQEPLHDDRETISTVWLAPRAALEQACSGRLILAPPTVRTLDDLDVLGTPARIIAAADVRTVTPILPKPVQVDGCMAVLYPGDAAYDAAVPGSTLVEDGTGRRNRAVMRDGGWRSVRTTT